jgi:hypothetical protein
LVGAVFLVVVVGDAVVVAREVGDISAATNNTIM